MASLLEGAHTIEWTGRWRQSSPFQCVIISSVNREVSWGRQFRAQGWSLRCYLQKCLVQAEAISTDQFSLRSWVSGKLLLCIRPPFILALRVIIYYWTLLQILKGKRVWFVWCEATRLCMQYPQVLAITVLTYRVTSCYSWVTSCDYNITDLFLFVNILWFFIVNRKIQVLIRWTLQIVISE